MKVLCVSDQIDPLVYADGIKQSYAEVDMILSAGNLPMDYLDFIANSLKKPLFFVLGNQYDNKHSNETVCVDGKVRRDAGLVIAGLGGSMRYNKGENQYTDFEMNIRMLRLIPALVYNRIVRGRFLDILLTHTSQTGIHDKGIYDKGIHTKEEKYLMGFKCFLLFMRVFKPKYLVHGHIPPYNMADHRSTKYQKTFVVNVYGHYLIDTDEIL